MSGEKEFIPWNGGECPVPMGTLVDVLHRNGDLFIGQTVGIARWVSGPEAWAHNDSDQDIILYRMTPGISSDLAEPEMITPTMGGAK